MSNSDEPSEEDKKLFRQMVGESPPSKSQKKLFFLLRVNPLGSISKTTRHIDTSVTTPSHLLVDTSNYTVHADTPLFYCQSAVARNQLQQFKRGELHFEGRLDLHGLTIDQARTSVTHFIQKHHTLNHRVLLLIHGKGKPTGHAILKNLVNYWLPQFQEVLAFVSAVPRDGGNGAVYVLLKR